VLYEGGVPADNPMLVGKLPHYAVTDLGWRTGDIYASRDFAMKVRFKHEMSLSLFDLIGNVIADGNIYSERHRGSGKTVVFVCRLYRGQPYAFFLPCKIDRCGRGIFCKTMRFAEIRKSQMKRLKPIILRDADWSEMKKAA
jgi:hypothetical protein